MLTKTDLPLYLDAASTTPVHPEVLEAMLPYFTEHFGNPNSQHIYGQIAKKAIDDARQSIATRINVLPQEIIFTSGATEAINLAIKGYWEANRDKGNHIITVKTEHKAVLNTCAYLETLGVDVTYLDVDHYGRITNEELRAAFRPDTILACVMHVNNETGLTQDVHSFAETCAEEGIAFFTDSTQAIGHIETDYGNPAITMACMSAHKIQGPKGVGFLASKKPLSPIIHGGQSSLESSTLPTPLVWGLKTACDVANNNSRHAKETRLTEIVKSIIPEPHFTIPRDLSSPHIAHISNIVESLNISEIKQRFAVSTGSACQSSLIQQSHVTKAMHLPDYSHLRFSI